MQYVLYNKSRTSNKRLSLISAAPEIKTLIRKLTLTILKYIWNNYINYKRMKITNTCHSVNWGITHSPQKHHLLFFSKSSLPSLNLQTVQVPHFFRQSPLCIGFSWSLCPRPLKNGIL